jgi:hypothetical protein
VRGSAARAHDEAGVERLAKAGLEALELPAKPSEPTGRGKRLGEQLVLAALIRRRTGARNARVADRLGNGHGRKRDPCGAPGADGAATGAAAEGA